MAKKKVVKKAAKPAAKKSKSAKPAKKSAAKKPVAKKAAKKPTAKKPAVKKSAAKKVAAKKPVKKVTAKKPAVKKPVAKSKPEHKKSIKQTTVKKSAAKTAVSKKHIEKPVIKAPETHKKAEIKKTAIQSVKKQEAPVVPTPVSKNEMPKALSKKEIKALLKKENRIQKPIIKPFTPLVRQPVKREEPKIQITQVDPNKTRYSDEELAEFKELIVKKLENSKSELRYLQEQISRSSELGGDDDARFKGIEDGTMHSEREYLSQMASRQIQYISHLEKALIRIENKTYGICRETGKLISKERLRAVPHATLSMEAKVGKG